MSPTPAEIASAAKTAGWITKKASELVAAYRDRKIAFVQDPAKVQIIKDTRKTAEFKTFGRFAAGRQRVLIQVGLALRAIASKPAEVEELRQRIIANFELEGLHLAQAVQHGALTIIHQALLDLGLSEQNFDAQMENVIADVDKYVFFVQEKMDAGREAIALLARLRRDNPSVFVIAALGRARETASEVVRELSKPGLGYAITTRSAEWTDSYILTPSKTS